MIVGRWVGWILLGAGLVALGWDVVESVRTESLVVADLGARWFLIDRFSLGLMQAVIQRYILPELWDPVITTLLLWPAFLVLSVPGVVLSYVCRVRKKHTWFI
ncbi:MAG: hypothetical protein EXQ85_00005 [Alphaproteobacteria bacterium]|nr:hypothetical protein [Alphaproteobacteria bacterium]